MVDNPQYDLHTIELSELIMIVGSYIFAGSSLDKVEDEVMLKLLELLNEECDFRLTGTYKNEIIH
jgi:hypothetical protein